MESRRLARRSLAGGALVLVLAVAAVAVISAPAPAQESVIEALERDYVRIDDASKPSVVVIDVEASPGAAFRNMPVPPEFRDLLPRAPLRNRPVLSNGSGFIIDADGWVLTNSHVVRGAMKITVTTVDGREYEVVKVHADPLTDVAVLKIEPGADRLVPAALGESRSLKVGQIVVAIGNPFGQGISFTTGVISQIGGEIYAPQLDETGRSVRTIGNLIQTDAAINPGNSGGPLLSIRGDVIGVTTAIQSRSGGSEGVGLAIPVDTARRIADQLIMTGKVQRAYIGILMRDKSREELAALGAEAGGAFITEIRDDGPASASDLEEGDVIVGVDDTPDTEGDFVLVRTAGDLISVVETATPGAEIVLHVLRFKEPLSVSVALGEFPDQLAGLTELVELGTEQVALGLTVTEVTDAVVKEMGLPKKAGVVVQEVAEDSPAAGVLEPGNVILGINGTPIQSPEDYRELTAGLADAEMVILQLKRKDNGRTVADTVIVPLAE